MSNVWGDPSGSNDHKVVINYKKRNPVHIPKVLTDAGAVYQQPAQQETSTVAGISPQSQDQINESKLSNLVPKTEVSKNGIERVVGYKPRDS